VRKLEHFSIDHVTFLLTTFCGNTIAKPTAW